jgi:hypothetical protein
MYLAWFDSNPKKAVHDKIGEARARYLDKFGQEPLVCLVNPDDAVEGSAVELRPVAHIARHCFWIGYDDPAEDREEVDAPAPVPAVPPADPSARPSRRARKAPAIPGAVATAPTDEAPARSRRPAVRAEGPAAQQPPAGEPAPARPARRPRRAA